MEVKREPLGRLHICVSHAHRFGTDAFLLAAFSRYQVRDVACDLGTGCGIIPLVMERHMPPRQIYGLDIQPEAIRLLEQTVAENRLTNLTPVLGDLRTLWADAPLEQCTLVTCNPPYKAQGAGMESAGDAARIARHELLCDISDVCGSAARLLRFGGRLCLCNRPERLCDVLCAMRSAGIEPKRLRFVAKHPDTAPWLFLVEGKKGAKPFLQVESTLAVRQGDGMTPELEAFYRLGTEEEA
ncbi:methyltransferase [uncultured Ruminococcus sp.]|uniref:tRNA1(Val) (adenine(37)-N6)-methyltransferase n=1 Tax=uncultured Ruminococcus sp. TaxID=165186 RepID=UPI002591C12E|nr:methyltransferase [uncultured Ruminococcus sp.]